MNVIFDNHGCDCCALIGAQTKQIFKGIGEKEMPEMIFYVLKNGAWVEFDRVKDRRDYAALVANVTAEREDAPAKVLRAFVTQKTYVKKEDCALLCRALRHFDEVGLSNKIFDFVEEVRMACDGVAIGKNGVEDYVAADFSGIEI